eukprot:SAG11_NODE_705_length_7655_cov_19.812599_4_plen_80_part_00
MHLACASAAKNTGASGARYHKFRILIISIDRSLPGKAIAHAVAPLSAPCQTAFKMFLASTERRSALRGCSAVRQYFLRC